MVKMVVNFGDFLYILVIQKIYFGAENKFALIPSEYHLYQGRQYSSWHLNMDVVVMLEF